MIWKNPINQFRGFTLIELMIGISILGILAVSGFMVYGQSQVRGRDLKRKQDLVEISAALETYYQQNGHFPCTNGQVQTSYNASGNWIVDKYVAGKKCGLNAADAAFSTNYMILPKDPSNTGADPWSSSSTNFTYGYYSDDYDGCLAGQGYVLVARLENKKDADSYARSESHPCDHAAYPEPTWGSDTYMISSY